MTRLCFVCLGNICRSPTAEAVMKKLVEDRGLAHLFELDSAGTASYHQGELADPRSREAARRHGYRIEHRARQFLERDFDRFELVLAMDQDNLHTLLRLAKRPEHQQKLALFRDFEPDTPRGQSVPDPYYGGTRGFDEVIEICERASLGLLAHLHPESRSRR